MEERNMPKTCPRCGSPYEGNVCPFCDYEEPAAGNEELEEELEAEEPVEEEVLQEEQEQAEEEPQEESEEAQEENAEEQPDAEDPNVQLAMEDPNATLGEDLGLELDAMGDLESEFGDLAQEVQQAEQNEFVEDFDTYAKGFPDWDLLPPR